MPKRYRHEAPVDHTQIRRFIDTYVRPEQESLDRITRKINTIVASTHPPTGIDVTLTGSVNSMNESFRSFAIGITLSILLLYLILVAQFRSFLDPFIILLALPPGITGVLVALLL